MSKLYAYYQKIGGDEAWTLTQADADLTLVSPTFITVLALDTILDERPSREVLDAIKYSGPMYFDLDSADIAESIKSAKELQAKFTELGLQDLDYRVYLSGKKGLHLIVPPEVFMSKVAPLAKLPAIYKEIAFKLAVDSTDFKVYTARKGRMLRTCHNIRDNGNYRVSITAEELRSLSAETYDTLCKVKRPEAFCRPAYRPQFALIFDEAAQKIGALKKRKSKPVNPQELKRAQVEIDTILAGENLSDIGFNKIAMQVCVYARDCGWNEETLINKSQGLMDNHSSDGYRYNTRTKRENELRRMYAYVDDNPAYEYSLDFLKSCLVKPSKSEDSDGEDFTFTLSSGVSVRGNTYTVSKGDDGEVEISNFVLLQPQTMLEAETGKIIAIRANLNGEANIVLEPRNFTSSAALQTLVGGFGKSFTGTDVHARGVYQIMLREVTANNYVITSEGLNYIQLPAHPDQEIAETPFLVWADRYRVTIPEWVREKGVSLEFLGYPEDRGVIQTDLTNAPSMANWLAVDGNKFKLKKCFVDLFDSSETTTIAKALGWMCSAHWAPLFHGTFGKFPVLHIHGRAGSGKCLAKHTVVRKADGSTVLVQNIKVGDLLLGPDGTPRRVLSTCKGQEMLYKVHQENGVNYTVNESHILSLRSETELVNIPVLRYLKAPASWRAKHYGWSVPNVLDGDKAYSLKAIKVKQLKVGSYYGFELDGDKLFCLGDFTVTHNTELTTSLLRMFYYKAEPKQTNPSSSVFAFLTLLGGSGSIPVLMDEWKPAAMNKDVAERYRSMFRSAYNGAETSRGGGNRGKEAFGALNTIKLTAPVVFMAEAAETEKAIVDRVVMLPFRRQGAKAHGSTLSAFRRFKSNLEPLSILGKYLAGSILLPGVTDSFRQEFDVLQDRAYGYFTIQDGDEELYLEGKLTKEAFERKQTFSGMTRVIYNNTVVLFGLKKLKEALKQILEDDFDESLEKTFRGLERSAYLGMEISASILPEYAQVLSAMSDLSRTRNERAGEFRLVEGIDYSLSELGGKPVLVLAARFAYNKYREFNRAIGQASLYPNEVSFEMAMREVPQYIKQALGTQSLITDVIVLDLEALQIAGVPPFAGKRVNLPL